MAVEVYRCGRCGREVLVRRIPAPGEPPLSEREILSRLEEEFRPRARGRSGRTDPASRLRDDIWVAISDGRATEIPRDEIPTDCPACSARNAFAVSRVIDG